MAKYLFSNLLGYEVELGSVFQNKKNGKIMKAIEINGEVAFQNLTGETIPAVGRPHDGRSYPKCQNTLRSARHVVAEK